MRASHRAPSYAADIYRARAVLDPYPHYSRMRALGSVVWLPRQRAYALTRYAECKAALLDADTFVSGAGVALNPVANRLSRGTTLNSDGDEHAARRSMLAHRLTPRALRTLHDDVTSRADTVVEEALEASAADGVRHLAMALPMSVVPDLVGWPEESRAHLLRWAGATFDVLGPVNLRSLRQVPSALGMVRFSRRVVRRRAVLAASMGDDLLRAVDDGRLGLGECPPLIVDYLAPSLDTTISAIASALHLFATHPDQWDEVRADPSLIPRAVNEVVRLETPVRAFSRKVARDTELGGVRMSAGSRVLVLYASANRDEREWTDPERFDIHREATHQLGFGHGVHGCAGQGLARLETQAVLAALAVRVERILPDGEPVWAVNNIIRRLERLPLRLVRAPVSAEQGLSA